MNTSWNRCPAARKWTAAMVGAMLLLGVRAATAQEQRCDNLGDSCVCSETFQSTSYTDVVAASHFGSVLGDQVGSKPCTAHQSGALGAAASIDYSYGESGGFAKNLQISTDVDVLALLPGRNPAAVARFLRPLGDDFFDAGYASTFKFGANRIQLGSAKRLNMRWYVHYTPEYDFAGQGDCDNGKFAHISTVDNGTAGWLTLESQRDGNSFHAYRFQNDLGWIWPGHPTFDGFTHCGPGCSGTSVNTMKGKWSRIELVVRRPLLADQSTLGFDYEWWVTNVTDGGAPVRVNQMSAGCTSCLVGSDDFAWTPGIRVGDIEDIHAELYRADAQAPMGGGCHGWQGWLYAMVAKWDTDAGQMIGAATEVEGGGDALPPAPPMNLQVR